MSSDSEITIRRAVSPDDIDEARSLFLEYEKELGEEACFHDFEIEMKNLGRFYAPPAGALLLAVPPGVPGNGRTLLWVRWEN